MPRVFDVRSMSCLAVAAMLMTGCLSGGRTSARVGLADDPDPVGQSVSLLVSYVECANGEAPADVEDVHLEETEESVTIEVILQLPRNDGSEKVTCPSNDWLAYTLELPQPLGNRSLYATNELGIHRIWPR